MAENAIEVREVWKSFRIYHQRSHTLKETLLARRSKYDEFWALKGVSFEVPAGEMLGIIGPNGSGKSTMLKCLARILSPDSGDVTINGTLSSLLELGTGFHPELSGRENVYLAGSILGLKRDEIDEKFDSILDFAGLGDFIDTPIKNYSSGMTARLAFSVAISIDPEVLLVDEVLAVGDEAFQLKCYERIWDLRRAGKTVVFVSHSLDAVRRLCSQVLWLEKGRIRELGTASDVVGKYLDHVRQAEMEARTGARSDGSTRWGSHEMRLTDLEILDGDGKPAGLARTGEAITFRIYYESTIDAQDVVITIKIHRSDDGECVTGLSSKTNPHPELMTIKKGSGHIDFTVEELPLWQGSFRVTIGAGDEVGTITYDWRGQEFGFVVVPANFTQGDGVVFVPGSWSIHPD